MKLFRIAENFVKVFPKYARAMHLYNYIQNFGKMSVKCSLFWAKNLKIAP